MIVLLFVTGCARSFVMTGLSTLAFDEIPKPLVPSAVTMNQIIMQLAAALAVALSTICFDLSVTLRNGIPGDIAAIDGRIVLLAIGAIGIFAVPMLLRLPRDAGDQLSGRGVKPVNA